MWQLGFFKRSGSIKLTLNIIIYIININNPTHTCVCHSAQLSGRAPGSGPADSFLSRAGLTGVGWVIVGHGAGRRADVKVGRLGGWRHGGVWGREARVGLLILQVHGGVPGQNAVLHTLLKDTGLWNGLLKSLLWALNGTWQVWSYPQNQVMTQTRRTPLHL